MRQTKGAKKVTVPQLIWWGDIDADLVFPGNWDVVPCYMQGHNTPKLDDKGYRRAFANPIGTKPIRELARGKSNVVIVFDNVSRPTRVAEIVPYVLEELSQAGVAEENIQFICALGTHGALTAVEFAMKLGRDVIARFNVYNHNPYENCVNIGKTSRGTPLSVNAEFMQADFKIGIGCIVPHPSAGFDGGSKIILPGIASIETITYNHGPLWTRTKETCVESNIGSGKCIDNALRLDMDEACRMSGLDIVINALVNGKSENSALFVGEPIATFYEGTKLAARHYLTSVPAEFDVIVGNCNAKINEANIGKLAMQTLLPEKGATMVLITNNPWGEVCHYLHRHFGNHMTGNIGIQPILSPRVKKFIIQMPYKNKVSTDWLATPQATNWAKTWDDVIDILKADYPDGARVVVLPDATLQYFEMPAA